MVKGQGYPPFDAFGTEDAKAFCVTYDIFEDCKGRVIKNPYPQFHHHLGVLQNNFIRASYQSKCIRCNNEDDFSDVRPAATEMAEMVPQVPQVPPATIDNMRFRKNLKAR